MDDHEYMQLAIAEAKRAEAEGEWPFGTVIVCGDRVIASTHVTERADQSVLSHSELKAVGEACRVLGRNRLEDCVIYCTAEPCVMCSAAICQAKIPRVVFGASRSDLADLLRQRSLSIDDIARDAGYSVEIVRGVDQEEVMALFSDELRSEHV